MSWCGTKRALTRVTLPECNDGIASLAPGLVLCSEQLFPARVFRLILRPTVFDAVGKPFSLGVLWRVKARRSSTLPAPQGGRIGKPYGRLSTLAASGRALVNCEKYFFRVIAVDPSLMVSNASQSFNALRWIPFTS
jgi:hypothetical protein